MFALVYVCLCFPRGRLASRARPALRRRPGRARRWSSGSSSSHSPYELPASGPFAGCAAACPHNALRVVDGAAEAGRVAGDVANAVTIGVVRRRHRALARAHARVRPRGPPDADAAVRRDGRAARVARGLHDRARGLRRSPGRAERRRRGDGPARARGDRGRPDPRPDVRRPPARQPRRRRRRHAGDRRGRGAARRRGARRPTVTLARWDARRAYRDVHGAPRGGGRAQTLELTRDGAPLRARRLRRRRSTSRPTSCAAWRRRG